jgi:drug/metabolite transporter (DMT)-like permease
LLTIYLVWGSTYLGIAVAIETVPPFLMAAIRFFLAGVLFVAWAAIVARSSFRLPTLRETRDAAISGFLLFGIANGFVGWAEETVPSGIAAILIALIPVWFAVFGRLFYGDRLSGLTAVGIAVGFVGVVLLVGPWEGAFAFDPAGVLILLAAPLAWSSGSLFAARSARMPATPHLGSAIQLLAGALAAALEAAVRGEFAGFDPADVSGRSIVAIAYLTGVGTLVAFTAYAWLLRHAPIPLVSTYAYVNPVVAVILGSLILAEPLTPRTLLAAAVIVVAVAIVVTARGRAQQAAPTVAARPTQERITSPT